MAKKPYHTTQKYRLESTIFTNTRRNAGVKTKTATYVQIYIQLDPKIPNLNQSKCDRASPLVFVHIGSNALCRRDNTPWQFADQKNP